MALVLMACSDSSPRPSLVVFAAGEPGRWLEALLNDAAENSGAKLELRWGDSSELTTEVIGKAGTAVDILITDNAADMWRAAGAGALRPIASPAFDSQDSALKDDERYWAALASYSWALLYSDSAPGERQLFDLDGLATPLLEDRLCMVSSSDPEYRALLAHLIAERGNLAAERLVRLWARNFASGPHDSETALYDAMSNAGCHYGVVRVRAASHGAHPPLLEPRYIDVAAIGVSRHAQNADAAQDLVDWLLRYNEVRMFEAAGHQSASITGWLAEDARLLAERAGYR
jgi:ABC-type Fe3+ transport system substrate-binding protein